MECWDDVAIYVGMIYSRKVQCMEVSDQKTGLQTFREESLWKHHTRIPRLLKKNKKLEKGPLVVLS